MFATKRVLLLFFLLMTAANYAQFTDVINSNRPGESMAAFSVGKTVIQAELGFYGFKEEHDLLGYEAIGGGTDLSVRYGAFFEQLEFSLDAQYQLENFTAPLVDERHSGFKQMTLGAKYLVYDPTKKYINRKPNLYSWNANHKFSWRQFIPAVGVYAGFNVDLSDGIFDRSYFLEENKLTPKFALLTQNQLGRYVLVGNVIMDKFGSTRESLDFIVTLTRGFSPRWSGFLECQGYSGDYYSDVVGRGGAAFLLKQNIQIDASVGTNFKTTPSLLMGAIGLSWRFDANYEEVMIRLPKDEKGKEKSEKDKKKEKEKKRIDGVEGGEKAN